MGPRGPIDKLRPHARGWNRGSKCARVRKKTPIVERSGSLRADGSVRGDRAEEEAGRGGFARLGRWVGVRERAAAAGRRERAAGVWFRPGACGKVESRLWWDAAQRRRLRSGRVV